MSEIKVNVNPETKDAVEQVSDKTAGLPSNYLSKLEEYRKSHRKNLTITQVPVKILDELERLAKERGLTKKQFFYEMLREQGVDIPAYHDIHKTGGF